MSSVGVSWRLSSGSSEDRRVHSELTKLLEDKKNCQKVRLKGDESWKVCLKGKRAMMGLG